MARAGNRPIIGQALRLSTTPTELTLGGNALGVEFAGWATGKPLALIKPSTNTALKQLDLGHTSLGVRGGRWIGQALGVNTTPTPLFLNVNHLLELAGRSIRQAAVTHGRRQG